MEIPPIPVQPIAYQTPDPTNTDLSHLKTLSIIHYVVGVLTFFVGFFPIIYIIIGSALIARGRAHHSEDLVEGVVNVMMACFGLLCLWTMAVLIIISGRMIATRKGRSFSVVIAAMCCMNFPFGTALGVFTIIVLMRKSVVDLYEQSQLPR